ncbi:MAG: bifunctional heptose 7-phosphate kinase/heptose 1-phosphate adenyltransferase [Candidatus Odinarchaeota archaeon]
MGKTTKRIKKIIKNMALIDEISKWGKKKVLVVGDALIDKYIFGYTDRISPDAPIPNVKIENTNIYIGAIGLVLQFIHSLGGIPEICTIIGNDFEGEFFLKKIKELKLQTSGILIHEDIKTPQITRIKAMNQHLLRLETDYSIDISQELREKFINLIANCSEEIAAILILDYGLGGIFNDQFIQILLRFLKKNYREVPIIARPTVSNYYLYDNIEFIKMNLQKALDTFSINCCNETSIIIAGKRILNASKCKNVLLNYLELDSYLFSREDDKIEKIKPILQQPVRSYVAVGSVIMAILGLSYASNISVSKGVKIALFAAALTATLPPVEFYKPEKLQNFIQTKMNEL